MIIIRIINYYYHNRKLGRDIARKDFVGFQILGSFALKVIILGVYNSSSFLSEV